MNKRGFSLLINGLLILIVVVVVVSIISSQSKRNIEKSEKIINPNVVSKSSVRDFGYDEVAPKAEEFEERYKLYKSLIGAYQCWLIPEGGVCIPKSNCSDKEGNAITRFVNDPSDACVVAARGGGATDAANYVCCVDPKYVKYWRHEQQKIVALKETNTSFYEFGT